MILFTPPRGGSRIHLTGKTLCHFPTTITLTTYRRPQILAPSAQKLNHRFSSVNFLPRRSYFWITTGGIFTGLVAFGLLSDGPTHAFSAVRRTMRVTTSLALCIRDYRQTMSLVETGLDENTASAAWSRCHQRCADRTLRVLEKNGSIFIKLGQHLSSLSYLLPREWVVTFIPLQDKCPVSSMESIRAMVHRDTGSSIDELFSEFDPEPIGAASLAQVHRAVLRANGKEVAVKIQHPHLAEWIPIDLALTRFVFTNIKFFFPEYPMDWLSDELEQSLPKELDFENEARNIRRSRDYFKPLKQLPLVIPDVIWATKRLLVMEYIRGNRLDDLEFLDDNGISRNRVSESLAHIFSEMVFGHNAPLHCDAHGGNLAIRTNRDGPRYNFDIILYDHGLYRDIPSRFRYSYAHLWLAIIDNDEEKMKRYAYEVGGITEAQFPLFASAISGRDYKVLKSSITAPRTESEKADIGQAMTGGLLAELIQLLSQVPRIVLLILKTNDLTRSLDENLCTTHGPERNFIIMAKYCARAVYEERLEKISGQGSNYSVRNIFEYLIARCSLLKFNLKLTLYEWFLLVSKNF